MKTLVLIVTLSATLALTAPAQTSMPVTLSGSTTGITATGSVIDGSGTYNISTAGDLLLGAMPTSAPTYNDDPTSWDRDHGSDSSGYIGGLPALTDGTYGGNPQRDTTATGGSSGGLSVTYTLGSDLVGGPSPLGYQLSDIQVYSAWNDNGRYAQLYTISYQLVGSSTWTVLTTVNQFPSSNVSSYQGAYTNLMPSSGTYFPAFGVQAVKFDFSANNPAGNNYVGYAELVVDGTVAPEPGTYALMGFGLAALILAVRMRRPAQA